MTWIKEIDVPEAEGSLRESPVTSVEDEHDRTLPPRLRKRYLVTVRVFEREVGSDFSDSHGSVTSLHVSRRLLCRNTLISAASEEGIAKESRMLRLFLVVSFVTALAVTVEAQAPGIDPRGLAAYGSPVIIGVVEEPSLIVIRPDRLAKSSTVKRQADGTFIAELPQQSLDYLVGYIFRFRVQEVLKRDRR